MRQLRPQRQLVQSLLRKTKTMMLPLKFEPIASYQSFSSSSSLFFFFFFIFFYVLRLLDNWYLDALLVFRAFFEQFSFI